MLTTSAELAGERGQRPAVAPGAQAMILAGLMITRALILAAGFGSRLREGGVDVPKPLQLVGGETLLARTVTTLAGAGIHEVWVVVGFRATVIEAAIAAEAVRWQRHGVRVRTIANPEFEKSNGVSILCARGVVAGPFVLSMVDHVYDVAVARAAAAADMTAGDLWLCVDRRLDEVYDIDDATKVKTEDGRIVDIGKTIPAYDCIDCGVFAINETLFASLQAEKDRRGDCSLSDGVKHLARSGRARVIDIGDAFWQDVDTPAARDRAERELAREHIDAGR